MKLKLAEGLSLPLETVTQTIAIVAKRRAGKSYTMRRLVEQLFTAGQQVVLVDPKGDQWGIRSAANGKGPGLPVVILGGEHGDIRTLDASNGEVVAKLVVEERVSVLLDLSMFRKHEVATFMTAFLENLYRLKAREEFRTPMMLVIDEADAIAPQKPQKGEERMLGAAEDIVRRGGQRGIGCVLVTQRSAVLNKNVLTQAQMLVALRTIAPQDLAAMDAWIQVHGEPGQRETLMESLPSLPVGDAWFWSPGWPTTDGIFKRVHVLPIETFDSGASPKPGEKRVEPKRAADVDLEALKRQMSATIEKAKADDPRELRKQIAELKTQLARSSKQTIAAAQQVSATPPKPILTDADRVLLDRLAERLTERTAAIADRADLMLNSIADRAKSAITDTVAEWLKEVAAHRREFDRLLDTKGFQKVLGKLTDIAGRRDEATSRATPAPAPAHRADLGSRGRHLPPIRHGNGDTSITPARQKILNGIAFLHGIGVAPADKTQLALIVGVSPTSGGYFNNLGALRSAGLIDYPSGGTVALTTEGQAIASTDGIPSTTDELHDAIRAKLPPAKWKIVEALINVYPKALAKDALAEQIDVSPTSGGFFNNLGSLRSLGLIEYPRPSEVAARPVLFLD